MKKKILIPAVLVASLTIFSFTPPAERYFEIARNLDIFASLFKEVNALYVDDVNPNQLIRTGIDAMLGSLDPYTNFIPEDEVEDYRSMNTGQYGGIGASTKDFKGRTVVSMVYDGYPAALGGLRIGDEIVRLGEIDMSRLTADEAEQLMRGQVGTYVSLSVKRVGVQNPIEMTLRRERIRIGNVPYSGMIGTDMGYVQLTDFTQEAGKEVRDAVVALMEQGAKSIVLDLRDNPGGLLVEAVNICNIFLPEGKIVVTMKGKVEENNAVYETHSTPVDTQIPVAVLVNRGSASASEIVAGTLQDYDRAVIIGEKSYGKGLVQVSRPLSYNSQVKITTAKYYTPTGRCIQVLDYSHRRPDGSVESVADSLKKPFKTTHGRTVYDGGGIDPDVAVDANELTAMVQAVLENGYIFDYATVYTSKHPSIPSAKEFKLTEAEYQEFTSWMRSKNFSYVSPVEKELEEVVAEAKREGYYPELKAQIDQITERLTERKKNDLTVFKDQIKIRLEEDIVSRYYFETGTVEAAFKYDRDLEKATQVLHNPSEYKNILHL